MNLIYMHLKVITANSKAGNTYVIHLDKFFNLFHPTPQTTPPPPKNPSCHLNLPISWSDMPLERDTRRHILRQATGRINLVLVIIFSGSVLRTSATSSCSLADDDDCADSYLTAPPLFQCHISMYFSSNLYNCAQIRGKLVGK